MGPIGNYGKRRFLSFLTPLLFALALTSCGDAANEPPSIRGPDESRQGDVTRYEIGPDFPVDKRGRGQRVVWSLEPAEAGFINAEGRFVGYLPGPALIRAEAEGLSLSFPIDIRPREGLLGELTLLRQGDETLHFTSDLWVLDDFALTGTWLGGSPDAPPRLFGDRAFAWDVSGAPLAVRTDAVVVDARTVNDVKIRADGALAVLTHEGSLDGLNGITLLDLTDPLHPSVITRFTEGLEPGVHNVWIEGDFVYAVVDGVGNGLRVIDVADPFNPRIVAAFVAETSFLHDVLVRDGLAFLSHWDDGLIILDVGNGIAGGSPTNPVEVSRIATAGGQTHNAWFWPEAGVVFVGEEDFETPGMMHVVDVRDIFNPRETATFRVPGETPHNFWLDEERGILYAAWYTAGVRAVDVNGELLGELDKQGREIAHSIYGTNEGCRTPAGTCTWAPQLHDGLLFLTDLNTGLWVLEPTF